MAFQGNWRLCTLCAGLYFDGHATKGVCPVRSTSFFEPHAAFEVVTFLVEGAEGPERPGTQDNWCWCRKCEGMFFKGNATAGVCPRGGEHDSTDSGIYRFTFGKKPTPKGQSDGQFRWCRKCEGMFLSIDRIGLLRNRECPAGGRHDVLESGFYLVKEVKK